MKRYNLIAIVFLISLLSSGTRLSALRHGNYRGGAETNVSRNANVHQHVNVNRNVNVNVNNNYHGGGCYNNSCCNHPVAAAAAVTATAVGTAAVVGSIVSQPPATGCVTQIVNGLSYTQCGSTWYQPQFSGSTTTYVVVNPPR